MVNLTQPLILHAPSVRALQALLGWNVALQSFVAPKLPRVEGGIALTTASPSRPFTFLRYTFEIVMLHLLGLGG